LRRGEFQAAQFKRIGKNGHEVWIEASYNPILDINGKPFKVVEFATDITAQVQMLANLKTLIDRNFGDIDGAVKLSSSQADLATGAVHTTSGTVQTMAASSEELAASVREISDMMMKSKAAVDSATAQVAMADQATQSLTAMSTSMGGIVAVISGIAQQINLLALNATIEAARAGDAGRGFAVVASEVKSLAQQAAQATSQISTEIGTLQSVTKSVVEALGAIVGAIELVQQFVTGTASSVEEQSVVTQQMSQGMQTASLAMTGINDNMAEITGAVTQVAQAMGDTRKAASVLVR
jgi:methyl-accepting chemotaxis protein